MNRFAAVSLLAFTAVLPIAGRTQTTTIAPPSSGFMVSYSYWPEQFVQFVGTELPYSMIELDVDRDGKTPIYNVVLTDRATQKRVTYANADGPVLAAKALGGEAHKTEIAFEPAETTNNGSISTVRLSMADGKPLQWRFVQGSDISEQGSGVTPLPAVPVPAFAYREQGAVAGEGTALQIGDVVSVASVWQEISHPPYFVAYHGAYTQSAHRLIFGTGEESWKVVSSPATLAVGSTWELDGEHEAHRTLKVERIDGGRYFIAGSDRFQPAVRFTIEATRDGDAWSVASVRYSPVKAGDKHFLTVQYGTPVGPATASSAVSLVAGKKTGIAAGTIDFSGDAGDRTGVLDFKTPAWVHGKALTEETKVEGASLTVQSQLQQKP